MNQADIEIFSILLEKAGFETEKIDQNESDALRLIKEDLIPLAKERHISLWDAAWEYANQDEEQDTTRFQLFHALQKIPSVSVKHLDIHKPL